MLRGQLEVRVTAVRPRSSGSSTASACRRTSRTATVRLFTRSLDDITDRLPEVVAALAALPVRDAVFDGELIALRADGRPYAFQDTASRAASEVDALSAARQGAGTVPLIVFLFDVLHLDGTDLIDLPDAERHAALAAVVPEAMLMPRLVTDDPDEATEFFQDAVARGHEGVVVKSLTTPYAAGRRGAGWIKVKPRHTLDLVVLAVEWGHGRRNGWLSNLHLGARDPETGGWVMLGKTFKGLTDELLTWQTAEIPGARRPPRRLDRLRPPGAGRGDRLRRRPALPAIPGRRRPEIRPGAALPRGQDGSGSRHDRHGENASAAHGLRRSGHGTYFFFLSRLPNAAGKYRRARPPPNAGGSALGPPRRPGNPSRLVAEAAGPPAAWASRSISASSSIDCGAACGGSGRLPGRVAADAG